MDDLMKDINMTEVLIRFGGSDQDGLSVRNAFNVLQPPEPEPAFSASNAIWNFTLTLVERGLVEPSSGNALFSPVSILTTLNMLLLGTTGTTRTEILRALGGWTELDIEIVMQLVRLPKIHGGCPQSISNNHQVHEQRHWSHSRHFKLSLPSGIRGALSD